LSGETGARGGRLPSSTSSGRFGTCARSGGSTRISSTARAAPDDAVEPAAKPRERHVAGQVDVALRDRVDETLAGQARRQILLLRLTAHGDEERPCSDLRDVHERRVPRATDDHPRRAEEAVAVA